MGVLRSGFWGFVCPNDAQEPKTMLQIKRLMWANMGQKSQANLIVV